jgi:hypothetical protein
MTLGSIGTFRYDVHFPLWGVRAYESGLEFEEATGKKLPNITHGYSKQHRPDLK